MASNGWRLHLLAAQLGTELTLLGGFALRVAIANVLIEGMAGKGCYDIVEPFSRGGKINDAGERNLNSRRENVVRVEARRVLRSVDLSL